MNDEVLLRKVILVEKKWHNISLSYSSMLDCYQQGRVQQYKTDHREWGPLHPSTWGPCCPSGFIPIMLLIYRNHSNGSGDGTGSTASDADFKSNVTNGTPLLCGSAKPTFGTSNGKVRPDDARISKNIFVEAVFRSVVAKRIIVHLHSVL